MLNVYINICRIFRERRVGVVVGGGGGVLGDFQQSSSRFLNVILSLISERRERKRVTP